MVAIVILISLMEKQRGSTSCPWPSPGRESWVSKLLLLSLLSHISCYRCKFLMEWERDVLYYGLSYVFLHLYSFLLCSHVKDYPGITPHSWALPGSRIQESLGGRASHFLLHTLLAAFLPNTAMVRKFTLWKLANATVQGFALHFLQGIY